MKNIAFILLVMTLFGITGCAPKIPKEA